MSPDADAECRVSEQRCSLCPDLWRQKLRLPESCDVQMQNTRRRILSVRGANNADFRQSLMQQCFLIWFGVTQYSRIV